jgi:hypothetical protein
VVLSDPGLATVGPPQYAKVDGSKDFGVDIGNLGWSSGPVYVLADQLGPFTGTVGARTVVNPLPQFVINGTFQPWCGSAVNAEVVGLQPGYNVWVELLTQDLRKLLDLRYTTADRIGDVNLSPSIAVSGPSPGNYGLHRRGVAGLRRVRERAVGFIPAPAATWSHLNLC